jgi:hypothetical protein
LSISSILSIILGSERVQQNRMIVIFALMDCHPIEEMENK